MVNASGNDRYFSCSYDKYNKRIVLQGTPGSLFNSVDYGFEFTRESKSRLERQVTEIKREFKASAAVFFTNTLYRIVTDEEITADLLKTVIMNISRTHEAVVDRKFDYKIPFKVEVVKPG